MLNAISPIDGRYTKATQDLSPYFSEKALIRYRIKTEVAYFIELCHLPLPQLKDIDKKKLAALTKIYENFGDKDAQSVKKTEQTTNHDIKAVEYFVKEKFDELGLSKYKEFVHFGLTSQDVNNTAFPMMIKEAQENVLWPSFQEMSTLLKSLSVLWHDVPMLAFTHGQPASPTTMGKELYVFYDRLRGQLALLQQIPHAAKFGGATGNFNAHHYAYPEIDWVDFANSFVNNVLGLNRTAVTTQIEPYDHLAALCDAYKRLNNILIDMCRDIWTYISMEYFKLKIIKGEVGSSAMPHKVNPIDFENAEGNLGMANAIFEHLAAKLPISRLQRDLTDSTVLRNIGVPLAHTLIALKSIIRGLKKITINTEAINKDLDNNKAVLAEAIQTILRREFYPAPYEKLKELTRTGQKITQKQIKDFIESLAVDEEVKKYLLNLKPDNYTGIIQQVFKSYKK